MKAAGRLVIPRGLPVPMVAPIDPGRERPATQKAIINPSLLSTFASSARSSTASDVNKNAVDKHGGAEMFRSQRINRGGRAVVQGGTESMGKVKDACGICLSGKTH